MKWLFKALGCVITGVVPTLENMDSSASSNVSSQDLSTESPKLTKLGSFDSSQELVRRNDYLSFKQLSIHICTFLLICPKLVMLPAVK